MTTEQWMGVVAFAASIYFFYQAVTYKSRPPMRWGLTKRAKIQSRLSAFAFPLAMFVLSILMMYPGRPPVFMVLIFILVMLLNILAMFYDQVRRPTGSDVPEGKEAKER